MSTPSRAAVTEMSVATPVVRSSPDRAAVIEVRDLNVRYGQVHALAAVSLDIPAHVVTAFVGPSGCGKSTLLRALNRMNDFLPAVRTDGTIRVGGHDIHAPDTDVLALRQRVGMVFQRSNPFPQSIFDNVAYGPRVSGQAPTRALLEQRVETSLRAAALWDEVKDRLQAFALTLPDGQQQQLCIARALAVRPEILLMDEPASALDPIATQRIEQLIHQLKRDYTIIIATHNMQQAARVSDRTAFFWLGRLVEHDRTDRIFTTPRHRLTEDYVTGRLG